MNKLITLSICILMFLGKLNSQVWVTTSDQQSLLSMQKLIPAIASDKSQAISINEQEKYQSIDGFGYTLTGGSAGLIWRLDKKKRKLLLEELFGHSVNSIGLSYLRISIGSSDLDSHVYSYDDLSSGELDLSLTKFSLSQDTVALIPLLKEILLINPHLKIMSTPWSPPVWMKDNNQTQGGHLLKNYYAVYAHYLVKYIQSMASHGIKIDAMTLQNEPQHGGNNPSMLMDASEQTEFIKNYVGPIFRSLNINTKIIIWDHNCDHPEYPIQVLSDIDANKFIDGSAFHMYNGDESALSTVKKAFPDKNLYFTEQWTGSHGEFGGDLNWHMKHVVIGSLKNWSRVALEWNLANDSEFGPHTPGGCTECKGALTITDTSITRNVAYYIIAHASRFILPRSIRIASSDISGISNVAFKRPDGKIIVLVLNEGENKIEFNVANDTKAYHVALDGHAIASILF